jgi:rhodanese-related sulfurtransferase
MEERKMFFNKKVDKQNKSIHVNEIDQLIGKINLIDIREPYEYQTGHIPSAQNIPMNNILSNPDNYLQKDKEYHIVCQSGYRSSMAVQYLLKDGFDVVNVLGGTGSYLGKLEI